MCLAAEDAERLGAPGLVANAGVRRLLKSVMLLETALSEVLCETKEKFQLELALWNFLNPPALS